MLLQTCLLRAMESPRLSRCVNRYFSDVSSGRHCFWCLHRIFVGFWLASSTPCQVSCWPFPPLVFGRPGGTVYAFSEDVLLGNTLCYIVGYSLCGNLTDCIWPTQVQFDLHDLGEYTLSSIGSLLHPNRLLDHVWIAAGITSALRSVGTLQWLLHCTCTASMSNLTYLDCLFGLYRVFKPYNMFIDPIYYCPRRNWFNYIYFSYAKIFAFTVQHSNAHPYWNLRVLSF